MDSENVHRDNGEHEHSSFDSSADLHQSNDSSFMDSSNLATTDSFHAYPHHNLSFPESSESKHGDLAGEIDRSIAENQVLIDEIASLRDAHVDKEQSRVLLEAQLHGSCERAESLTTEVVSLEAEKKRQEDMAARMVQGVQALQAEKMDLLTENGKIVAENKSLDASCTETSEKLSALAKDLDEKRVAMAAVQTRVHVVCFEIEKLQLEKEEFSKEVSLLDASNSTIDIQISHLREQEKALSDEIDHVIDARALTKQKVSDAQTTIAALGAQISTLTENNEGIKNQLHEAEKRLVHLQEQDRVMALREADMESHIMDLESELYTLKANFTASQQAVEQAKEGESRTQEVALMKVTACEREIAVLNPTSQMHERDVYSKQQHVKDLETQVAHLREENEALASSNENLEAVLKSQEEPQTEESNQMKEDIKTLEGALKEAAEKACVLESKEVELKSEVQELRILVNRNPTLAGLMTPLVISGGTIVALGLLVFLLRSNSKSK